MYSLYGLVAVEGDGHETFDLGLRGTMLVVNLDLGTVGVGSDNGSLNLSPVLDESDAYTVFEDAAYLCEEGPGI